MIRHTTEYSRGWQAAADDWTWIRYDDPEDDLSVDDIVSNAWDDGTPVPKQWAEGYADFIRARRRPVQLRLDFSP